ncbi:glutamate 5-kinase [Loigolactobacillus backii]|uniref:Glutamate 5-kinase n=1 Tax=Loigolactobacillus backii TaxID=375175 RepID=A0A192H2Z1_9LACO|nr:glutamate 5-kinase [Loigolactobacillus backii]ANK59782.1 gamma-glutamyl kinase [Loigolactobacillus backii]ANK63184.1 gamma-glutamyl kinase [Loigolactobacillus backii]ANK66774.1 gamma-glutamyl kinase [Loigolactobacillus backii]ANK69810.1 gamma-glutamyl kinase [Loigolactobacillus backii]MDA5387628.1 glutamate 5-kinase [Loigolactobacillus backii]
MKQLRALNAQRIVVKVGTSSLIYANSQLKLRTISRLAMVLSDLKNQGKEVILVSSGAIGVGMGKLGLTKRPTAIPDQQAIAAIGQSELMAVYDRAFANYDKAVAQMLLTRDVITYPQSHANALNTFERLLKFNVIPIVNENDVVSLEELDHKTKFSDNDQLSAIVTNMVAADLLIVLSDIDGFYDANPNNNPAAKLLPEIDQIGPAILKAAGGHGSQFGTGGMVTKLKAAERVLAHHQQMVLANGKDPQIIYQILAGEPVGTLFRQPNIKEQAQ